MIYDRPLTVFKLDTASPPTTRRLTDPAAYLCAYRTVYHRTYFQAVQAGESIDRMVQLRAPDPPPDATMYAVLEDGHVYRIREAQLTEDEDGLPAVVLSLHREEARYDYYRPVEQAEDSDGEHV